MAASLDSAKLIEFCTAVYAGQGVPEADARLIADTLVQADLWGHQSHGVLRLDWYLDRLRNKVMNPVTQPEFVIDGGAMAVIDGHDGVGHVLAKLAAEEAIKRAKKHGIGAVGVRMSNHFGTCMYYTLMGARQGCVMMLTSNGGPAMAPWGGRKKIVGTNPWSIAAPAGKHAPFVVDMANTGVARGKIYLARNKRQKIPLGWAIDADGAPTTDPQAAIDGIILPMAEHKGYAIAAMVDMMSGVLTGSGFLSAVHSPYKTAEKATAGISCWRSTSRRCNRWGNSMRAWSSSSPRSSRCRWRRVLTRCFIRARWRRVTTRAIVRRGFNFRMTPLPI
jgi:LDH2 family malate/lactate/ureidoglycolate dehydrogenase